MPSRLIPAVLIALLLCCLESIAATAGDVDETALREYAMLKRADRVAAETRRLRKLYPGWTVPADLWTAKPSGPDETPLWDLFEAGNLAALKLEIKNREDRQTGWHPSSDLARKIAARELRTGMLELAAKGDWVELARLTRSADLMHASDDLDMSWLAAEALARTGSTDDAVAIYRMLLEKRSDPPERTATLRKALAALPMADVERLIAAPGMANSAELTTVGIDITRSRMNAFLRGEPGVAIEPAQQAAFEGFVREANDPQQAGLIAWDAFRRGAFDKALEWFKWSIARGGDATVAQGLSMTLSKLGFRKEAEDVAYGWRGNAPGNAILFIDSLETELTRDTTPQLDASRVARYAQVTLKLQSGEGAQALAWYSYNACQFEVALQWFQHAAAWFPKEATIYGYALTLQRLKRQREFLEIVNRYDGLFPSVVGLLYRDDFVSAPSACDRRASPLVAVSMEGGGYAQTGVPAARDGGQNIGSPGFPRPDIAAPLSTAAMQMRQPPRTEFPLPAAPENPLRYADQGALLSTAANVLQVSRREPRFDRPLVARRVPGAGPMPYERLNFVLLPAWNGVTAASFPPTSTRPAAAGTLAAQQALLAEREPLQAVRSGNTRAPRPFDRFHP